MLTRGYEERGQDGGRKEARKGGRKDVSNERRKQKVNRSPFSFLSFHHQFCMNSKNCTTKVKRIKTAEIHIQRVHTIDRCHA